MSVCARAKKVRSAYAGGPPGDATHREGMAHLLLEPGPVTLPNRYPWIVLDPTGRTAPTGCWSETAAVDLADRLSKPGARHVAVGQSEKLSPVPNLGLTDEWLIASPWPEARCVVVSPSYGPAPTRRVIGHRSEPVGWRWFCLGATAGNRRIFGPTRRRRSAAQADAEATFSNVVGWSKRRQQIVAIVKPA